MNSIRLNHSPSSGYIKWLDGSWGWIFANRFSMGDMGGEFLFCLEARRIILGTGLGRILHFHPDYRHTRHTILFFEHWSGVENILEDLDE